MANERTVSWSSVRPGFKQASENLFLQIAESGAIDKPALAPIGFGVSALEKGDGPWSIRNGAEPTIRIAERHR